MLNIPPDHPARDLWDTLYVDVEGHLLRTHTSPGQIHVMRHDAAADPGAAARPLLPLRGDRREPRLGVLPGRGPDGRRGHDHGATSRACSTSSRKAMYGADKRTRFRPGYYPFTEPSVAFDVECLVCGGSGCPACSRTRLDDDPRGRDGPPGRAPVRRPRPGALPGLRLRDGRRADRQAAPRHHATCACSWTTTCASWSQFR